MADKIRTREKMVQLQQEGLSVREIARRLMEPKSTVARVLKRYKETRSLEDKPITGRPRTVRTQRLIKNVREKIRRNPNRSKRKLAKDHRVSPATMRRVVKFDLKLYAYKFQKRQVLSEATRLKRKERGRELLKRLYHGMRPSVIGADEKIFTVERAYNQQNDRVLALSLEDVPVQLRTEFKRQHPDQVMVFGGVTDCGKKHPLW